MHKHHGVLGIALAAAMLAAPLGGVSAQTASNGIPAFGAFVDGLGTAPAAGFVGKTAGGVASDGDFEAMRQHLLTLYRGVAVSHSYMLGGQVLDCIPVDQQPAIRFQGLKTIAAPPPTPANPANKGDAAQTDPGLTDAFGNREACQPGYIPMRRLTLDELARFNTLRDFFQKAPNGAGQPDRATRNVGVAHKYAVEGDNVDNFGGYGYLNLWNPTVNTALNEIFSLSQHWYIGGSGAGSQTAEVGWQNYPQKYGTVNSSLFIYWTADDYRNTGCYNLDCAAFVQVDNSYGLGAGFANYSVTGGSQYELGLGYYYFEGNWWLAVGSVWLGYYPGTLYNGGQLTQNAQVFQLGGETTGTVIWPPMGSGHFPGFGFGYAAYHRGIFYRDAADDTFSPSLTLVDRSVPCYSLAKPSYSGSDWAQPYFFFGGPGGKKCSQ